MTQKPVLILLRNSKVENLQQLCNELGFISVSNYKRVQISESIVTEVKNPGLKNVHITLDEFLTC